MKKFLRLGNSHTEIPKELDASILAYAAMRTRVLRRKRIIVRLSLPATAITAAAAAAVIAMFPSLDVPSAVPMVKPAAVAEVQQTPAPVVSKTELLALGDTTVLDQESYNLAICDISRFSIDGDIFMM